MSRSTAPECDTVTHALDIPVRHGRPLKMTTFNVSKPLTFGIEMELKIIKEADGLLSPSCLMAQLPQATRKLFMPEATQATIEFVSTVHSDVGDMLLEAIEHLSVLKQTAYLSDVALVWHSMMFCKPPSTRCSTWINAIGSWPAETALRLN
ncbi:MAG: hypothetical protein ACOYNF_07925 [Rhodoferax sp.]